MSQMAAARVSATEHCRGSTPGVSGIQILTRRDLTQPAVP